MYRFELFALFTIFPYLWLVSALPAADNDIAADTSTPRIGDVLSHLSDNGGVTWTNVDKDTRYTFHTYAEWAAAEAAVAGKKVDNFCSRMASNGSLANSDGTNPPSATGIPTAAGRRRRHEAVKRDSSANRITGGLSLGNTNRYAYYYCFNSGQWGSTSALTNMAPTACNAVMRDGLPDGVHTWQSLGYVQTDHNTAAWFIQRTGIGGDFDATHTCADIFDGFRVGGVPKGAGPWCNGNGAMGSPGGQWTTQGGYVRWYNNQDGSLFVGGQRGELRIDPNKCNKNGKPCANDSGLASGPESMDPA